MDKCLKWVLVLILLVSANANANEFTIENNVKSHELIAETYKLFLNVEEELAERKIIIGSIDDLTVREGCSSRITLSFPSAGQLDRQAVCAGEVLIHMLKVNLDSRRLSGERWAIAESARVKSNTNNKAPVFLCNSALQEEMVEHDIQVIEYYFSNNDDAMYLGTCHGNFLEKAEIVWHQQN